MDPSGRPALRSFERHLYAKNRAARIVTTCLSSRGGRPAPSARPGHQRRRTELVGSKLANVDLGLDVLLVPATHSPPAHQEAPGVRCCP